MTELDLTEAIEAAREALHEFSFVRDAGDGYPAIRMGSDYENARTALTAAAPLIERQVRERVAQEIKDWAAKEIRFQSSWPWYELGEKRLTEVAAAFAEHISSPATEPTKETA